MTQPDYKFYKKKILKYLVGNYVIVKTKKTYISIINPKYKIFTKDGGEQIPASILLDNIKKIFGIDDSETATVKKIIRYWSKNKLNNKNWFIWRINSSGGLVNMPYVIQDLPPIVWDHFTPNVSVSSRYAQVNLNQRYYSTIDAARLEEEVLEFNIKIKPIAPVQHIDVNITMNNEQT
jgi:hypothetical protein